MYSSLEGRGSEVTFPGPLAAYRSLHTDTSQDILARFHVFASLCPDKTGGMAFNVADGDVITWEDKWPSVCAYFGLKGVGPDETHSRPTGTQWIKEHRADWDKWVAENDLRKGIMEATKWNFMESVMGKAVFDRHYDLSACREIGFNDKVNTVG